MSDAPPNAANYTGETGLVASSCVPTVAERSHSVETSSEAISPAETHEDDKTALVVGEGCDRSTAALVSFINVDALQPGEGPPLRRR